MKLSQIISAIILWFLQLHACCNWLYYCCYVIYMLYNNINNLIQSIWIRKSHMYWKTQTHGHKKLLAIIKRATNSTEAKRFQEIFSWEIWQIVSYISSLLIQSDLWLDLMVPINTRHACKQIWKCFIVHVCWMVFCQSFN